jgi:hypothetical protein
MDETTLKIYTKLLPLWKKLSKEDLEFELEYIGFDEENNLEKLSTFLITEFEDSYWESIPMQWFEQWLPYADQDLKNWHEGWVDFEDQYAKISAGLLPEDTELDYGSYQGAELSIKQGLVQHCQPLKDAIIRMCQDKTLYDPI